MEYGLREILNPRHHASSEAATTRLESITLTTSKNLESRSYIRHISPSLPDLDPSTCHMTHPFYRPGPAITLSNLPHLRQSVLYVFPEKSAMATPQLKKEKMKSTGVGVGGSGGEKAGAVVREVLRGRGICAFLRRTELGNVRKFRCGGWKRN